jgi:hypothetical protein
MVYEPRWWREIDECFEGHIDRHNRPWTARQIWINRGCVVVYDVAPVAFLACNGAP